MLVSLSTDEHIRTTTFLFLLHATMPELVSGKGGVGPAEPGRWAGGCHGKLITESGHTRLAH